MRLTKITSIQLHSERVWQVAIHPSQPLLATASSDRSARLLSLRTLAPLSSIDGGHKRSVRSVAWKPNTTGESVLATGSFDATAGIWRRWDLDPATTTTSAADPAAAAADDADDDEWRFAVVLDGHESEIKSVAWSAGGTFLATCSRDKSVWVWEELDDDNFETVAVLAEHTQDVKAVAWHPAELLLASASYDDTVRLYREDVDDWGCCAVLRGHAATVWGIAWERANTEAEDGEGKGGPRLASCSDDLEVRIWRRVEAKERKVPGAVPSILRLQPLEEEWVCEAVLPRVHERSIYSVAWSATSGRIVSCGGDGWIVVYEEVEVEAAETAAETAGAGETAEGEAKVEGKKKQWRIQAQIQGAHGVFEINCVQWSKRWDAGKAGEDEEIVVSAGDDGEVGVWQIQEDVKSGSEVK
ncbi:WD40-repeat-containing domain protein [Geopyxis carbonaria]|nr:WD40-repeat-containing domain protein [Geopyxis carbonaria]